MHCVNETYWYYNKLIQFNITEMDAISVLKISDIKENHKKLYQIFGIGMIMGFCC